MATDIVSGLFGVTPESYQAQRDQAAQMQAMKYAEMDPFQQANYGMFLGGSRLAGAAGQALGAQDPQLQKISTINALSKQFDTTTPEGVAGMANALKSTYPDVALQLSQQAQAMKSSAIEAQRKELSYTQEETLRKELSALGPQATEQDILGVVSRYGPPAQILSALQRSADKTAQREAMALEREDKRQVQEATKAKTEAETARLKQKEEQEENLRSELAALPPDASDNDVQNIVRKYGTPDKILATLEKRQQGEANRIAKAELERDKATEKAAQQLRDQQFKQQMASLAAAQSSATTGLQRQMLQLKIDDLQAKQNDKAEAKVAKTEVALNHANKVISDVNEAQNLVTGLTTGLVGKGQSFIPGTDAYTLKERIGTLKANLGFDRLQQMRDASPTGGALGQVAVQELNALQSSVASLDVGLPKKELEKNLNKIENHYSNWIRTTKGEKALPFDEFMKTKAATKATPVPAGAATGGWSIKPVIKAP